MMASDSEESDYEDARQHHDGSEENNETVDQSAAIVNSTSTVNARSSSSQSQGSNVNAAELDNSSGNEGQSQSVPVARNNDEVGDGDVDDSRNNDPVLEVEEQQEVDLNQEPVNNEHEQGLLRRLQGYLIVDRPNAIVDSDDDDVDTISDDSDLDFPMLDDNGENRYNRACKNLVKVKDLRGASDDNDGVAEEIDEELEEFDQELPIRHAYLGEGMEELPGRVVLADDATPEIPLIAMGIHLIPGQTLPLTIFHAVFQNAIRRCVMSDRLFGIVHNDMDLLPSGNVVYKGALGTLAEIFEYQEESDGDGPGGMSSSFALKAKGRERFNVIDVRRQADGNLMGTVRIRPEIKLEPFVLNILLPSTSRCYLPKRYEELDKNMQDTEAGAVLQPLPSSPLHARARTIANSQLSLSRRDSLASTISICQKSDGELLALQSKAKDQRRRLKYYAALTPHPYFVYEHYDDTVLVEKVHRLLKTELKGLTESRGKIPTEASDLSFWLAQNLTMDDSHRTKILKMDSPIQRLRYELELLARTTKVISCRNCQTNVADHSQIFSMSIEGPQGTYVNPHGFVHETLTVYKAKELITRGAPSTEASWFPGYSWTIVECKRCKSHIGWKFQAVGKLKPSRFWGLARRSVIFKYDFGSDSDIQESLDTQRTPPNSANSEAYSTVAFV